MVVIGNGMAGARLVEDVLSQGGAGSFEIVMFGDEPYGNYNRILLSSVLSGGHDPKDILINPLSWYERNHIKLHAGVRVTGIDRQSKTVHGDRGVTERYDKLVIATGSKPLIPPMEGLSSADGRSKQGVFVFRTLDDCDQIISYAAKARKAAVIGGGLLGLEAARGLLKQGLEVNVVHLMGHLMEVQLDPQAGAILKLTLEKMGIRVHVEKSTTAVLGNGHVTGLAFKDGSTLDCDMVVVSAGIRPNVDLAKEAGLPVKRGIIVGDDLASPADPDIYAVGECAEHDGRVYGLVAPLWEQTEVLAGRLAGSDPLSLYRGSSTSTKLKVMGVELAVMGEKEPAGPDDEVVTYSEPARGIYKKVIVRDGQLAGAILLGDGLAAPSLLQAFYRGTQLPDDRSEVLFAASNDNAPAVLAYVPDSAQICNCNGVTKGQILTAIQSGRVTLKAVCDATRAGTGCGSCKPQVRGILEIACDGLVVEDPAAHYYVPESP